MKLEITVSPETMEKLKAKAEIYSKDIEWLAQQGVEIACNLDAPVFTQIHNQAARLELPLSRVIENYFIDRWAYESAESEVNGPVLLLTQFARNENDEMIIGEELFNMLKNSYTKRLKDYNILQTEKADKQLADRMTELNKYLLPGEQSANIETLRRRRDKAEFLKNHPGKEAAWDKAEARQREHEAKFRAERKQQ